MGRSQIDMRPMPKDSAMSDVWFTSTTITCPVCGHRQTEDMPGQLWSLTCKGCGHVMHPPKGECCVFCAYGDAPCPDAQITSSCSCGAEGARRRHNK